MDGLKGANKECSKSLYFVHFGVVDWRLIIKKTGIVSPGFAVRQLGFQACKYVQHLP